MDNKLKEKIDKNKEDKTVYKEYIKSFTDNEITKELFSDNEDFKNLLVKENKKEEDEFF